MPMIETSNPFWLLLAPRAPRIRTEIATISMTIMIMAVPKGLPAAGGAGVEFEDLTVL